MPREEKDCASRPTTLSQRKRRTWSRVKSGLGNSPRNAAITQASQNGTGARKTPAPGLGQQEFHQFLEAAHVRSAQFERLAAALRRVQAFTDGLRHVIHVNWLNRGPPSP